MRTMGKAESGDIYLRLMIAILAILIAMAGGTLTFILKTNDNNLKIASDVGDIRLMLVSEQFEDKNIMKDLILPAYELSLKNAEEIAINKKSIHSIDSVGKVNRSNIIRVLNYVKPKGASQ